MKKLLLVIIAVVSVAFPARGQLYLGGGIGFGSDSQNKFMVRIAPEIGYWVNNTLTVGGRLSYQSGNNVFGVDPYIRLNILNYDSPIRLLATGHVPMTFASQYFSCGVFLQPGLSIRVSDSARLEFHIGNFGWRTTNSNGFIRSGWEATVNGNNISIGVVVGV